MIGRLAYAVAVLPFIANVLTPAAGRAQPSRLAGLDAYGSR